MNSVDELKLPARLYGLRMGGLALLGALPAGVCTMALGAGAIRIPVLDVLAGASLQGLFRNPLADPGLIGVSSGGALGAVSMIVMAPALACSSI